MCNEIQYQTHVSGLDTILRNKLVLSKNGDVHIEVFGVNPYIYEQK